MSDNCRTLIFDLAPGQNGVEMVFDYDEPEKSYGCIYTYDENNQPQRDDDTYENVDPWLIGIVFDQTTNLINSIARADEGIKNGKLTDALVDDAMEKLVAMFANNREDADSNE